MDYLCLKRAVCLQLILAAYLSLALALPVKLNQEYSSHNQLNLLNRQKRGRDHLANFQHIENQIDLLRDASKQTSLLLAQLMAPNDERQDNDLVNYLINIKTYPCALKQHMGREFYMAHPSPSQPGDTTLRMLEKMYVMLRPVRHFLRKQHQRHHSSVGRCQSGVLKTELDQDFCDELQRTLQNADTFVTFIENFVLPEGLELPRYDIAPQIAYHPRHLNHCELWLLRTLHEQLRGIQTSLRLNRASYTEEN